MEPDVIRMYSSSPPPLEDAEEDDDFGDFDGFSSVPNSVSFSEFDTPTSFDQAQALNATSPPELLNNGLTAVLPSFSTTISDLQEGDLSKANGVLSGGSASERTVGETKKAHTCGLDVPRSSPTEGQSPVECNGDGPEVLTNGFAALSVQGNPQNSVHSCRKAASTEGVDAVRPESQDSEFADFAAFADAGAQDGPEAHASETLHSPAGGGSPRRAPSPVHCSTDRGTNVEGNAEEAHRLGLHGPESSSSSELPDKLSGPPPGLPGPPDTDSEQPDRAHEQLNTVCTTTETLAVNGFHGDGSERTASGGEDGACQERTGAEEVSSDPEEEAAGEGTEAEAPAALEPPPSADPAELQGDPSGTDPVPSAPPREEDTTVASPPPGGGGGEDETEDFGDFDGDGGLSSQGFTDLGQSDVRPEGAAPCADSEVVPADGDEDYDDFGDFNTPRFEPAGTGEGEEEEQGIPREESNYNSNDDKDRGQPSDFPGSDSFGNFTSVAVGAPAQGDTGWSAFSEEAAPAEEDSWAAFGEGQGSAQEEWSKPTSEATATTLEHQTGRTEVSSGALSGRLERLFQQSFPGDPIPPLEEEVPPLKCLLEPVEEQQGVPQRPADGPRPTALNGTPQASVWRQLLDIHEAFGLRHQWGGSHSNKTLLCSLGIDTRNILFTGQKKQAMIVPMYAASLGMLEPTKEPVKPISAAEMIASIAQAPPAGPEKSPVSSDPAQQDSLPPVQFDWSSSGLTNPLDASGGSSLLNLDFFGPVEDSGSSSSTSIPGVDPELYELTTAKLDSTGSGRRVVDAFARLMSTMEKTSTSARKPKKEERLSEEAAKVMASLPDLSFMQAKVLMFPTTLTPLGCSRATPD